MSAAIRESGASAAAIPTDDDETDCLFIREMNPANYKQNEKSFIQKIMLSFQFPKNKYYIFWFIWSDFLYFKILNLNGEVTNEATYQMEEISLM